MNRVCYRLINTFEEIHPNINKEQFYRYLYLCVKAMLVDDNFEELEKVFKQSRWLDENLSILKDMLIEEDFAHSCYKPNISRAVGILVLSQRNPQSEYNDDFNELITLNNINNDNDEDTTIAFIKRESQVRRLPFSFRMRVLSSEECLQSLFSFDAVVYQICYIDQEMPEYNDSNKKAMKIYNTLLNSSINKIETDYLPIDNFPRILKKDE